MGISLYADSKYVPQKFDMSYGGFFALRSKVANAFDEEFGKHYSLVQLILLIKQTQRRK